MVVLECSAMIQHVLRHIMLHSMLRNLMCSSILLLFLLLLFNRNSCDIEAIYENVIGSAIAIIIIS